MNKIRVGLAGFGVAGRYFHAPFLVDSPHFELVAVASSRTDEISKIAPKAKVFDSAIEMLSAKPDLIVVATPNNTHFEIASKALTAGIHVVADKPFVCTTSEGEKLIEIADKKRLILSVYHNRRWDNGFLTLKKLIADGSLGDIKTYTARFDRFRPVVNTTRWREQDLEGSGLLFDIGSHLIDQALSLFGMPKTLQCVAVNQRPGAQTIDYFALELGYGALRVNLRASCLVRGSYPHFEIHGESGSYIKSNLDPQEDQLRTGKLPNDPELGVERREFWGELRTEVKGISQSRAIPSEKGSYLAFYSEMAAAILSGKGNPVPPEQALDVVRLIALSLDSNTLKETIII